MKDPSLVCRRNRFDILRLNLGPLGVGVLEPVLVVVGGTLVDGLSRVDNEAIGGCDVVGPGVFAFKNVVDCIYLFIEFNLYKVVNSIE